MLFRTNGKTLKKSKNRKHNVFKLTTTTIVNFRPDVNSAEKRNDANDEREASTIQLRVGTGSNSNR